MSLVQRIPSRQNNPFATCWTKPGSLHYQFNDDQSIAAVAKRLAASGWSGQIVGPHGSGKSTLLADLIAELRQQGRAVHYVAVGPQRAISARPAKLCRGDVLTVDGFDQLGWWDRWWIARRCRASRCGLVVTSHRLLAMPILVRTAPNLVTVQRLVDVLTKGVRNVVTTSDIAASYVKHNGNVREIFFDLYDRYERHARQSSNRAAPVAVAITGINQR